MLQRTCFIQTNMKESTFKKIWVGHHYSFQRTGKRTWVSHKSKSYQSSSNFEPLSKHYILPLKQIIKYVFEMKWMKFNIAWTNICVKMNVPLKPSQWIYHEALEFQMRETTISWLSSSCDTDLSARQTQKKEPRAELVQQQISVSDWIYLKPKFK